jgi:hypothetical protein
MVENKTTNYLEDVDLYYEIILSKGKGYLTKKAESYFILVAEGVNKKLRSRYKDEEESMDCFQQGLMIMFENWKSFNEKRYGKALPYITEIFKRGATDGQNQIRNKKYNQKDSVKFISIERSNEGKGLHNI